MGIAGGQAQERKRRRSFVAAIVAVTALLATAAIALAAGNSIKVNAPASVKYGASFTYTVSGHASRGAGASRGFPPNLIHVDVLTSPSPGCPGHLGRMQSNLITVLSFHSRKTSQPLSQFSRTGTLTANGKGFGLCAYLLNFPAGYLYAHAAVRWTVTGSPPPPPPQPTLTVSVSGIGRVTGQGPDGIPSLSCGNGDNRCSHSYPAGTVVELIEQSSSTFAGWGGACSGTDKSCDVTVNSDTTVTATFNPS